jgi:hypothetical protein
MHQIELLCCLDYEGAGSLVVATPLSNLVAKKYIVKTISDSLELKDSQKMNKKDYYGKPLCLAKTNEADFMKFLTSERMMRL